MDRAAPAYPVSEQATPASAPAAAAVVEAAAAAAFKAPQVAAAKAMEISTKAMELAPNPRRAAAAAASRIRQLADFYDMDALNLRPTLALGTPVFLLFGSASLFLEVYVLSTATAHLAIFLIGSYLVFSTYFVGDHYMKRHSTSYDAIPDDKKFYVLSNLIKSAVLLAYCPSCVYTLYRAMAIDDWSTPRIRNMGVLYAIPDAVSLLLVSRMAWSTKVHHLCVVAFMVANLFVTYEEETIGRALVVYAIFSTFAYLVNLLLASRFLPVSPKLSLTLSALALLVYSGCLGVNWAWQLRYLHRLLFAQQGGVSLVHGSSIAIYLALISQVVWDDCVLVRWLWKNVGKQWAVALEAQRERAATQRVPGKDKKL